MKLIDKDALVAEIEKIRENIKKCPTHNSYEEGLKDGRLIGYEDALHKINTLEVKEVNLDKEIKNEIDEYWYDNDCGAIQRHGGTITMEVSDVKEIAKHFFELGLSTSQLTWRDIRIISEIGEKFMNSEESDHLSEEEYYTEILNRFKARKGE